MLICILQVQHHDQETRRSQMDLDECQLLELECLNVVVQMTEAHHQVVS